MLVFGVELLPFSSIRRREVYPLLPARSKDLVTSRRSCDATAFGCNPSSA
jgi:hypothetical protein